ERLPGVTAAGAVSLLPGDKGYLSDFVFGRDASDTTGEPVTGIDSRIMSPGYFTAMEIPLVAGRNFNADDTDDQPRVVIVGADLADRLGLAPADLIGRTVRGREPEGKSNDTLATVIGVAAPVRYQHNETAPPPSLYFAQSQSAANFMSIVMRTTDAPM